MFEIEKNTPLDPAQLAELFARCGWQEEQAELKLSWVLACSTEWVACRFQGELIGFGRSCRLGPLERVLFDVVVDPRFNAVLVKAEILKSLTQDVGGLEQVSVFTGRGEFGSAQSPEAERGAARMRVPAAPADAYLGARNKDAGGAE